MHALTLHRLDLARNMRLFIRLCIGLQRSWRNGDVYGTPVQRKAQLNFEVCAMSPATGISGDGSF
jgi:hypothetical protein